MKKNEKIPQKNIFKKVNKHGSLCMVMYRTVEWKAEKPEPDNCKVFEVGTCYTFAYEMYKIMILFHLKVESNCIRYSIEGLNMQGKSKVIYFT